MNRLTLSMLLACAVALAATIAWMASRIGGPAGADHAIGDVGPARVQASATREATALVEPDPVAAGESIRVQPTEAEGSSPERAATLPAGSIWLEGRVVFPDGTPLDEVVEIIARGKAFPGDREDPRLYRTKASEGGEFRVAFAKGTKRGRVTLRGRYVYVEKSLRVKLAEHEGELLFEPMLGGCLSVQVHPPAAVDPAEIDWDKVVVSAEARRVADVPRRGQHVAEGLFEIGGVPPGPEYRVNAATSEFVDAELREVEVAPGEVLELELAFEPGASVSGRVVDGSAEPVKSAQVRIKTRTRKAGRQSTKSHHLTTDEEGEFRMAGLAPGEIEVEVVRKGYAPSTVELDVVQAGESREVTVRLEAGDAVEGIVQWPGGAPAEGVVVSLRKKGNRFQFSRDMASNRTDEQGRFRISGLGDATYELRARTNRRPPNTPRGSEKRVWLVKLDEVRANGAMLLLVLAESGTLPGRVVDDAGEPVSRFTVIASPPSSERLFGFGTDGVSSTFKGEAGEFGLDGLSDGEWLVHVKAAGYGHSKDQLVTIPWSGPPLTLVTPRAASVAGVVLDPLGAPIAGAQVTVSEPRVAGTFIPFETLTTTTDELGQFKVDEVPPGDLELTAEAARFASALDVEVSVEPGEQRTGVVLTLQRPCRITGEVDASLAPVGSRGIMASGVQYERTITDERGRFAIEDLPPGKYSVTLEPPDDVDRDDPTLRYTLRKTEKVELVDGGRAHVVFGGVPEDPIVVFGLVRRGGQPVAEVLVSCRPIKRQRSPATVTTDAEGRYELTVDGPGRYTFNIGGRSSSRVGYGREISAEERVEQSFDLPAGRIAGRLVGPDGELLRNEEVELHCDKPADTKSGWTPRLTAKTDDTGAFQFDDLGAGEYTLRAGGAAPWIFGQSKQHGRIVLGDLTLEAGAALENLEVELPPPATLDVSVMDAAGQPVAGARIEVMDDAERKLWNWLPSTTSSGRLRIEGIGVRSVRVRAAQGDVKTDWASVKMFGRETSTVALTLN